jgi:hypothetical protein
MNVGRPASVGRVWVISAGENFDEFGNARQGVSMRQRQAHVSAEILPSLVTGWSVRLFSR